MKKGTVKWFNVQKGYGFITDEDGNDVFVHFTGIEKGKTYVGLDQGDEVEFEIVEGNKGDQAGSVVLTKSAERKSKDENKDETPSEAE